MSKDRDAKCTCPGVCSYDNQCGRRMVVYLATCRFTGKVYIGSTQKALKSAMRVHIREVKRYQQSGKTACSFARHFGETFCNFRPITGRLIRNSIHFSILWQGDPKTFPTTAHGSECALCRQERLEIQKRETSEPGSLINRKEDRACAHAMERREGGKKQSHQVCRRLIDV